MTHCVASLSDSSSRNWIPQRFHGLDLRSLNVAGSDVQVASFISNGATLTKKGDGGKNIMDLVVENPVFPGVEFHTMQLIAINAADSVAPSQRAMPAITAADRAASCPHLKQTEFTLADLDKQLVTGQSTPSSLRFCELRDWNAVGLWKTKDPCHFRIQVAEEAIAEVLRAAILESGLLKQKAPSLLIIVFSGWNAWSLQQRTSEMECLNVLTSMEPTLTFASFVQQARAFTSTARDACSSSQSAASKQHTLTTPAFKETPWLSVRQKLTSLYENAPADPGPETGRKSYRHRADVGVLSFAVYNMGGRRKEKQLNAFKEALYNKTQQHHLGIVEHDDAHQFDETVWLPLKGPSETCLAVRKDNVVKVEELYAMRHEDGHIRHSKQESELFAVRVTYLHPVLGYHHLNIGIFHLHYTTAKATAGVLKKSRDGFFAVLAALKLDIVMGDANQAVEDFVDVMERQGVCAHLLAGKASWLEFTSQKEQGYDCMGIWGLQDLREDLTCTPVVPLEDSYNYRGRRSVVNVFFQSVIFLVL